MCFTGLFILDIQHIKQLIDKAEVVSFDMFDTLVVRPYLEPSDLFLHVEKIIAEKEKNKFFFKIRKWGHRREKSERIARAIKLKKQGTSEVNFGNIYNVFSKKYGQKYAKYKQLEIELELQTIQPNLEMQDVYNYAISKKKRVIINSDMYLNSEILIQILNKCGYFGFEKLYVSSEINTNKQSGGSYNYICKSLNVKAEKCVHIGDNKESDYTQAIKHKWKAYYYQKPSEQFFANKENKKFLITKEENKNNLDVSIILGLIVLKWLKDTCGKNKNLDLYWENFGYNFGGAVGYGFVNFILEQSRNQNIKDILFVARDGYTLQKIYNYLKEKTDADDYYIHGNRNLLLQCIPELYCKTNSNRINVMIYFFSKKSKKINDFFRKFYKKNIKELDNISSVLRQKYLLRFKDDILKISKQNLEEYQNYIKSLELKSNDIAIVDLMALHYDSQRLLISGLNNDKIIGYYIYASRSKRYMQKYNAWCSDYTKKYELNCYPLFEILFSAPYATTMEVRKNKPIYQNDGVNYHYYNFVSNGILEFTKDVKRIFGEYMFVFDYKNCVKTIDNFALYLSKNDIGKMKSVLFFSDINTKSTSYQEIQTQIKNKDIKKFFVVKSTCLDGVVQKILYKLFGKLTLMKIIINKQHKKYYLFRFIPICIINKK